MSQRPDANLGVFSYPTVARMLAKKDVMESLRQANTTASRRLLVIQLVNHMDRRLRVQLARQARDDGRLDAARVICSNWFSNLSRRNGGNLVRRWSPNGVQMVKDHRLCAAIFVTLIGVERFQR